MLTPLPMGLLPNYAVSAAAGKHKFGLAQRERGQAAVACAI